MGWPPAPPAWPTDAATLIAAQVELASLGLPVGGRSVTPERAAGCFVCFERGRSGPGIEGERGWAAAALIREAGEPVTVTVRGMAGAPYRPGLLAQREGPLLEAALLSLPVQPSLLVVNATGADHPRGAGLAMHLGARLDIPSIGVTNRPLVAAGSQPEAARGSWSPLRIEERVVAAWVRTRRGTHPVVAHAGWRTDVELAVALVLALAPRWRTPLPLRQAREAARDARARELTSCELTSGGLAADGLAAGGSVVLADAPPRAPTAALRGRAPSAGRQAGLP